MKNSAYRAWRSFCTRGNRKYSIIRNSFTNKDLDQLVEKEFFRRDFYFRLATIKVEVPTLNRHPQNIVPMALHFLAEFSRKYNKSFTGIGREAKHALTTHAWKSNIRELQNLIERAVLLGQGPEITQQDLRLNKSGQTATDFQDSAKLDEEARNAFPAITTHGFNLSALHDSLDRHYFQKALEIAEGNATNAT